MEDETYHFAKDSISLDDFKKSEEECLSFIDGQHESESKPTNYEKELENVRNEPITGTSIQESHLKSELYDEGVNITILSTTPLNSVSQEDKSNLENELKYESHSDLFQAEHIVPMVEIKQEPFKGSCRLVRLQAAQDPPVQCTTSAACVVKMSNDKDFNICSENLSKDIGTNEIGEILTSQAAMCPEEDYQFLTPKIPSSRQQACVSSNSQLTGSNFQPVLSASQNNSSTPISSYECTSLSRFGVSQTDTPILRYDKVRSHSPNNAKIPSWIVNSSSSGESSASSLGINNDSSFQYSVNPTQESSPVFRSAPNVGESHASSPQMQRFLTADNQIVYGYKDPNGEFHFFCNNERESHNEKERKRRSRVSDACSALRKIIPGMSDKTDKATVFEQAANYLKFLREKFGMQFDQAYCEKYFQERA